MTENLADRVRGELMNKRRAIAVVGDVMVDRWYCGALTECQDGCKKFVQQEVTVTPGGAANAERSLHHWENLRTSLHGFSQNDCPVKHRYLVNGEIVFRVDDDGPATRGAGYGWARDLALEMVRHADGVLLSDYDKGFLTPEFIREVAVRCAMRSVPCVVDAKRNPIIYGGALVKCNLAYYTKWANYFAEGDNAVVTRGNKCPVIVPQHPLVECGVVGEVECANHVGAGDCFAAHLVLGLVCGLHLKEAAAFAHSAGRVYVQHLHSRPPRPVEVAADLAGAPTAVAG